MKVVALAVLASALLGCGAKEEVNLAEPLPEDVATMPLEDFDAAMREIQAALDEQAVAARALREELIKLDGSVQGLATGDPNAAPNVEFNLASAVRQFEALEGSLARTQELVEAQRLGTEPQ